MLPNKTRVLVSATENPANEAKQTIALFQDKVAALITSLNSLRMSPCDTLLGYKVYPWPACKHMALDLHLSQQSNMLGQFHLSLLNRVKVHRNFPLALTPITPDFEGFGLKILELEQGLESTSHTISLWALLLQLLIFFGSAWNSCN